jgi:hypothetical protein
MKAIKRLAMTNIMLDLFLGFFLLGGQVHDELRYFVIIPLAFGVGISLFLLFLEILGSTE